MKTRIPVIALAVTVSLAFAAPALAKPTAYAGKTSGGNTITFKRSGNSILAVNTMVPTSCASTYPGAVARAGAELFQPPGRLALGREVTVSALQDPAMHYNEVTKNYRVNAKKSRNGTVSGRLHVNFSYQALHYGYDFMLVGYVCQGDATFKAKPVRR